MLQLGRIGVWSGLSRWAWPSIATAATTIESLGYGAWWIPGGNRDDVLDRCEEALAATERLVVATGVLNIWRHDAAEVARRADALRTSSGGRFLLGLGVSHAPLIGTDYQRPLAKVQSYLDDLDAAGDDPAERVLAALRPRMLELAAERSAGAHPYLVPPEHTARARSALGPGPLLAPEQAVVVTSDPSEARRVAREFFSAYVDLPNYMDNLRHLGFSDEDLARGGSDRVLEAVVAWGSADRIARRVEEHLDAGADHVSILLVPTDGGPHESELLAELAGSMAGLACRP